MPTYSVEMTKISEYIATVEVEASTEKEARRLARELYEEGEVDWMEDTEELHVDDVRQRG